MRVVSGGQTGADQAGLWAARVVGLETGGWVPKGWKTDIGPASWLADYGCREHASDQYAPRTIANVREAQGLIWIGDPESPGGRLTLGTAASAGILVAEVVPHPSTWAHQDGVAYLRQWIQWAFPAEEGTLLIAGNRERRNPGIETYVKTILTEVFKP